MAEEYKKKLDVLKKATSARQTELLNKPAYNITAYDQKSYESVGGKGLAKFKDYKGLGIKNEDQYFKIKNQKLKPASTVSSKLSDVMKKVAKKTVVGKVLDTAVKVGAGVGAGYEYAKSKFKDKEEKVDKKKLGGMNKSKLKKAVGMGAALLASNYVGKRAGEADATLNAAKRITGIGEFEKPSAFGFSISPESRVKSTLNLSSGGDVEIVKGGDYIKDLL